MCLCQVKGQEIDAFQHTSSDVDLLIVQINSD